jgi:hypothetical protein
MACGLEAFVSLVGFLSFLAFFDFSKTDFIFVRAICLAKVVLKAGII